MTLACSTASKRVTTSSNVTASQQALQLSSSKKQSDYTLITQKEEDLRVFLLSYFYPQHHTNNVDYHAGNCLNMKALLAVLIILGAAQTRRFGFAISQSNPAQPSLSPAGDC